MCLFIPFFAFTQQNSILSSADWYKIAVEQTGIYKLTYEDLQNYGIDVGQINPHHLSLYGNPAGMLNESLVTPVYTDLQPLAIQVVGEEDGFFDPQDYVLFYGQGPDLWEFDQQSQSYKHITNIYSRKTYYFLTIGTENGKRIQIEQSTDLEPTATVDYYDLLINHEQELVNPGKTGRTWLGEDFSQSDSITFIFETSNTEFNENNYFNVSLASKCTEQSQIDIKLNGAILQTITLTPTTGDYGFYSLSNANFNCSMGGGNTEIRFIYSKPNDSAQAWIDHFEIKMKMNKSLHGDQMPFLCAENVGPGAITQFSLAHNPSETVVIWNVTDPMNVKQEALTLGTNQVDFRLATDSLLEFQAFNNMSFYAPEFIELIENQNLHDLTPPDLLIVTCPEFQDVANQLASFHNNEDNFLATTVTLDHIYNEFSSGAQDITAIRNFVKYLRDKSSTDNKPAYLLLFGDASYDYLDRVENNTNFVPTYESVLSSNSVNSFASDQYFGLNSMDNFGGTQVSVGRIPVGSKTEANTMLNIIENYHSNNTSGSWKNNMMLIADDSDSNIHLNDAEQLDEVIGINSPVMNISKCYLDFFELIQSNEGPRYPEVNETITKKTNEGVFYVNYIGHGSADQLASEQVLSKNDLVNWTNSDNRPLWVIASGPVGCFDNPEFVSLGEAVYLNQEAGAIALIASSGATFAAANKQINSQIVEKLTDDSMQGGLRFGDLLPQNYSSNSFTKWNLLGDPALKINFPEFNVITTAINEVDIDLFTDTIQPGASITLHGQIVSKSDGNLQYGFSGTVYLQVMSPTTIRSTRGNQESSMVVDVVVQDSILVKSNTLVENGQFEISISLPANSWEGYGNLKLSWYAEDGETDANGFYSQLIYGGNPSAIKEYGEFLDLVKVYPTIFTDYLDVEIPQMTDKEVVYQVYNSMGLEVYSQNSVTSNRLERIHLLGLASGMYILNLNMGAESKMFKVFKQ